VLAEARGMSFEEIARATRANTLSIFNKMTEGRA
jgi:Tat protein secretion system quality control protein TatD with DNase activity